MGDGATSSQLCHSFATHSGADTVTATFSGSGASWIGMAHVGIYSVNAIDQDSRAVWEAIRSPQSPYQVTLRADE